MKVGGFCNQGPGAERDGRRWGHASRERQSERAAVGVPCGGTEALTPGRAGSPGLAPSLDCQSAGPGKHLRLWSPHEPQPHGIWGGRWIPATANPPPLQWPCGPILPAFPLPGSSRPALWRQTHLERGSWHKNPLRGSEGSASPVGRCPCTKGKFRLRDRHTQRQDCVELGGRPSMYQEMPGAKAGAGTGRTSHSPRDPPCPRRVLDSQPPDRGGTQFCY